jgi:hypothetical protein
MLWAICLARRSQKGLYTCKALVRQSAQFRISLLNLKRRGLSSVRARRRRRRARLGKPLMATDSRPALLVHTSPQRRQQAAEKPATEKPSGRCERCGWAESKNEAIAAFDALPGMPLQRDPARHEPEDIAAPRDSKDSFVRCVPCWQRDVRAALLAFYDFPAEH